jgi:hypothetical protein
LLTPTTTHASGSYLEKRREEERREEERKEKPKHY